MIITIILITVSILVLVLVLVILLLTIMTILIILITINNEYPRVQYAVIRNQRHLPPWVYFDTIYDF